MFSGKMVVDLSGDSDDDSDDASDASEIDIELDEEGIIDLSNDDVDPIWRDDVDHYVEVNGLLLFEYKICGAIGCLQVTQLDYCTAHLSQLGLCVKSSSIDGAGFGLFATRAFKKDENVAKFAGAPGKMYDNAKYILSLGGDNFLDCAVARCAAACANTLLRQNNCSISHCRRLKQLSIKSNVSIPPGSEILISYGTSYSVKTKAEADAAKAKKAETLA